MIAPSRQVATVKRRYAEPLRARLLDASGQPLEGVGVTFTLTAAAGGAGAGFADGSSQANRLTDANGEAISPPLVANKTAGSFTATASAGAATPVSYSLRNLAGRPASVTAGAASGESTPVGTRFPIRLAVEVADADGNPVAGTVVTFAAPAHGASGRFVTPARQGTVHGRPRASRIVRVATDGKGISLAPVLTAGRKPGGYAVVAAAGGQRAAFALVNEPRQ